MKTTLDIPDDLFRQVKSLAALKGVSLRQLVTDTLRERLLDTGHAAGGVDPPWMKGFGGLAALSEETRRIQGLIEEEFEKPEEEPCRFRALAAHGSTRKGMKLLDKLDAAFAKKDT